MSVSPKTFTPASTSNLTLRQLRAFAMTAAEQSMKRAADKLHLTPSALSMLIRSLEEEVGARLFERTTRSIKLTEAGSQLLPAAGQILALVDEAISDLKKSRQRKTEVISVATSPLLAASLMPEVIAAFREGFPNVRIALHDVPVDQVAGMVMSGEADLGICTSDAKTSELHAEVLYKDRLMMVCTGAHPLSAREVIHWTELCDQALILLKPGTGTRNLIDQALSQWSSSLTPAFEVANVSTALGLVAAGLGVSVLPAYSLARSDVRGIIARPLIEPEVQREIVALSLHEQALSSSAESLLMHFRQGHWR